jgi:hypothetical protein
MDTKKLGVCKKSVSRRFGYLGLIGLMVATNTVSATGVPVVDGAHILTTTQSWFGEWGKTAAQWGKEGQQWKQTWDHYMQQLIKMKGLVMSKGLDKGVNLQSVDENTYMVAERCGSGFNVHSLTSNFSLNSAGNIYEQQRQICGNIQRVENMKYNLTVKFMKDNVPSMENMLEEIAKERNTDNNQGTVEGTTSKSAQMSNALDVNFQNYQSQIATYDAYAESLGGIQRVLARGALKGKQGMLGSFVKTAALKTALEVGN